MSGLRQIYQLLKPKERFWAGVLMVLMIVGALVEAAGIGMILPFIALVLDPGVLDRYEVARWVYQRSGMASHQSFVLFSCILLVGFFVLKNMYLFFLSYYQNKFVAQKQIGMSEDLFWVYLQKPYDFFFAVNTADLQRNLNESVSQVSNNVLLSSLSIFSEALVLLTIFILLLVVDPLSSGAALVFCGVALALFNVFSSRRIHEYSQIIARTFANMVKWLNQGVGGIKEIRISGCEKFFLNKYLGNTIGFSNAIAKYQVVQALPRSFFEIITVAVMVLIVIIHQLRGAAGHSLISTLGLFAMASFRLMPAMNRIAVMLTNVRFGMVRLQLIYDDLMLSRKMDSGTDSVVQEPVHPILIEKEICLQNVKYHYPATKKEILAGVDLCIQKGSSVGIIGSSGAGKSTLVNIILGLLLPVKGAVTVDGIDIRNQIHRWQRDIGYIPQQIYLLDDSITRNVALGIPDDEIDINRIWEVLEISQLKEFAAAQPEGLNTRIGEQGICLSGGQRQRIGIARALYHDPQVLVLDEATSALDGETERSFMSAVAKVSGEKTLIIVAHRLSTLERCDVIYRIEKGKVVDASDHRVKKRQEQR